MADLASGGVVGAAFGEGFTILHDTVKHVVGQIIMFKSELKRLCILSQCKATWDF